MSDALNPPDVSFASFLDVSAQLSRIAKNLTFLSAMQTAASELRVSITSGTLPVVSTVTTVSTVTNLNNISTVGGFSLSDQVMNDFNNYVANAIRANITRS